jgi:hypothetical protein
LASREKGFASRGGHRKPQRILGNRKTFCRRGFCVGRDAVFWRQHGKQHTCAFSGIGRNAHCRFCIFPLISGEHQTMDIPENHHRIVDDNADCIRSFVSIDEGEFVRVNL